MIPLAEIRHAVVLPSTVIAVGMFFGSQIAPTHAVPIPNVGLLTAGTGRTNDPVTDHTTSLVVKATEMVSLTVTDVVEAPLTLRRR